MGHGSTDAATAGIVGAVMIFYAVFVIAVLAFSVWLQWRILAKAGYNGALSLLVLTGIGGIIPTIILAFGKWPLEAEVERLKTP